MDAVEKDVLTAYKTACDEDPKGAFAPYFHSISAAAGGDPELAYATCKSLKKRGLLTCGGERQGAKLFSAPSYWITDEGATALNGE